MIICGGLQILILLSVTGILVSLAALSRLMELIFTILQPTVFFMLRQSIRLIVFWIGLILQQMSNVLRQMCSTSTHPIDTSAAYFGDAGTLNIGTAPVQVPYARFTYQGEKLPDFEEKTPSPEVENIIDPVENAEEESTQ